MMKEVREIKCSTSISNKQKRQLKSLLAKATEGSFEQSISLLASIFHTENQHIILSCLLDLVKGESLDCDNLEEIKPYLNVFPLIAKILIHTPYDKNDLHIEVAGIIEELKTTVYHLKQNAPDETVQKVRAIKEVLSYLDALQVAVTMKCDLKYIGDKTSPVDYFLFEQRNLSDIKRMLQLSPYLLLVKKENEKSPLEEILENYTQAFQTYICNQVSTNLEKLVYYQNVLTLMAESEFFEAEKACNLRDIHLQKIQNIGKTLRQKAPGKETLKKIDFYYERVYYVLKKGKEENLGFSQQRYFYQVPCSSEKCSEPSSSSPKIICPEPLLSNQNSLETKTIITIDQDERNTLEDALSLEQLENGNYLLGVHVTDVYATLPVHSRYIKDALKQGSTIYLQRSVITMFPAFFLSEYFSLKEGAPKQVLSYYVELSPNGDVSFDGFQIKKEWIQVKSNLSFEGVNNILKEGVTESRVQQVCCNLNEILPSVHTKLNIHNLYKKAFQGVESKDTPANRMLETAMLLSNYLVAKHFQKTKEPFIFRFQDLNFASKREQDYYEKTLRNHSSCDSHDQAFLRGCLELPQYGLQSRNHWGNYLDSYAHTTGPGRKGAALLAQECIHTLYFGHPDSATVNKLQAKLQEQIPLLNSRERLNEAFIRKQYTLTNNEKRVY